MGKPITSMKSIPAADAAKLQAAGIETLDQLVDAAAQNFGRAELAQKTGIPDNVILEWVKEAENIIIFSGFNLA